MPILEVLTSLGTLFSGVAAMWAILAARRADRAKAVAEDVKSKLDEHYQRVEVVYGQMIEADHAGQQVGRELIEVLRGMRKP